MNREMISADKRGERSKTADKALSAAKKFNKWETIGGLIVLGAALPFAAVGVAGASTLAGGAAAFTAWNGAEYVGIRAHEKSRDKRHGPKLHKIFHRKPSVYTQDLTLAA